MSFSDNLAIGNFNKTQRLVFVTFFVTLIILRNGITIFNPTDGWIESIRQFPNPIGFTSISVGTVAILKLMMVENGFQLILVNSLVSLILLFAALIYFSKLPKLSGMFLGTLIAVSPLATHVMSSMGNPDVYLYLGWMIMLRTKSYPQILMGGLLVATAHPYQALIGAICLYLISLALQNKHLMRLAIFVTAISLTVVIIVSTWANATNSGVTRENLFVDYFASSVTNFLANFPNALFAYLGPVWLIVILIFLEIKGTRRRIFYVTAVLIVPASMAISTADGTRVYLGVVFPTAISIIAAYIAKNSSQVEWRRGYLVIIICLMIYPVTYQITDFMYTPWMGVKSHLQPFVEWWATRTT